MHAPRSLFQTPATPKARASRKSKAVTVGLPAHFTAACDALGLELLALVDDARAPVLALAERLIPILQGKGTDKQRAAETAAALRELTFAVPMQIETAIRDRIESIGALVQRESSARLVTARTSREIGRELCDRTMAQVFEKLANATQRGSNAELQFATAVPRGAFAGGVLGATVAGVGTKVFFPKSSWRQNAAIYGAIGATAGVSAEYADASADLDATRADLGMVFSYLGIALFDLAREAWELIDPSGATTGMASTMALFPIYSTTRDVMGMEADMVSETIRTFEHLQFLVTPTGGVWSFLFSARGLYQLPVAIAFWVASTFAWLGAIYRALHPADDAILWPIGIIAVVAGLLWTSLHIEWGKWSARFNATSEKRSEALSLMVQALQGLIHPHGVTTPPPVRKVRALRKKNGDASFVAFCVAIQIPALAVAACMHWLAAG